MLILLIIMLFGFLRGSKKSIFGGEEAAQGGGSTRGGKPKMTPHDVHGHKKSELVMWLPNLPKFQKKATNRQTDTQTDPLLYISKIYNISRTFDR